MEKRHQINVLIGGIIVKKLEDSRGVAVSIVFKHRDLINQNDFMVKQYNIINRVWYDRLVLDYARIGIHIIEQKNLEEQLRKGIGKSVNITYLEKGDGYSSIFFESAGVDDENKSMSVDDVLESILAKEPQYSDNDFMDDDEPMSEDEIFELLNQ